MLGVGRSRVFDRTGRRGDFLKRPDGFSGFVCSFRIVNGSATWMVDLSRDSRVIGERRHFILVSPHPRFPSRLV